MARWIGIRFLFFVGIGLALNFSILRFDNSDKDRKNQQWRIDKPKEQTEVEATAFTKSLLNASKKSPDAEALEGVPAGSDRELEIALGEKTYSILALVIGAEAKSVTIQSSTGDIIQLNRGDLSPNGRRVLDITLNSLELQLSDGSTESVRIYEKSSG